MNITVCWFCLQIFPSSFFKIVIQSIHNITHSHTHPKLNTFKLFRQKRQYNCMSNWRNKLNYNWLNIMAWMYIKKKWSRISNNMQISYKEKHIFQKKIIFKIKWRPLQSMLLFLFFFYSTLFYKEDSVQSKTKKVS